MKLTATLKDLIILKRNIYDILDKGDVPSCIIKQVTDSIDDFAVEQTEELKAPPLVGIRNTDKISDTLKQYVPAPRTPFTEPSIMYLGPTRGVVPPFDK